MRGYLQAKLPDYMLPSAFVPLDALPLTPNGKVDRRALPALDRARPAPEKLFVAPRTAGERLLAEIWADVLRLERVGVYDNFFALGGDSILSLQVISRAARRGLQLTLTQLFQRQTIAALAAGVQPASVIVAEQEPVVGPVPLLPFQHWLLEQNLADPHHWNQAVLFEVRRPLQPELLHEVVRQLLIQHDALRLRFSRADDQWGQVCAGPDVPVPFTWIDLSTEPEATRIAALEAAAAKLQASLDLAAGPPLRVAYFHLGAGQPARLLIIIHHLVTDGVSWRIVLEDFQTAYEQLHSGAPIQLPPKTTSLKYWAERLTSYARSGALRDEPGYWLDEARAYVAGLPVDHLEGRRTSTVASASTRRVWLDGEATRALLQVVPAAYQVRINDLLLTALAWAFRAWTGSSTLLMEMEGHGREALFDEVDLSRTAGWLASLFPIMLDVGGAATPVEALGLVKSQLARLPRRGIGYGLLRYLSGDESIAARLRSLPQAEVRFNYLGQFDQVLADDAPFVPAREFGGAVRSPRGNRRYLLEIDGNVVGGQLQVGWTYSRELHHDATIARVSDDFVDALRALIAGCAG